MLNDTKDKLIAAILSDNVGDLIRELDSWRSVEERFELEYTPLHIAAKCARLLLEAGANPNQGDVDCCTPMVRVASMAMLELLMEHGADPNIPDQCGHKPSYWATNAELKNRLLAMENMGRRNSRG